MATRQLLPLRHPEPFRLTRRMQEWSSVCALILTLMAAWTYQTGRVQGQAERAAVQYMLGVLRTAFVLHHLQQQLPAPRGSGAAMSHNALQRNPFALLGQLPPGYAGEARADQAMQLPPGSWLFDPDCNCIAYRPLHPQELSSPSGEPVLWFDVSAPPEPLQLRPRERYVWQGQVMN